MLLLLDDEKMCRVHVSVRVCLPRVMHLVRKTVDAAMGISFRPEQGKRITSTELAGFYGIGTFEREP